MTIKIFIPSPNEGWILDRIIDEFKKNTNHIIVNNPKDCDIIFLRAGYIWNKIPLNILQQKKVLFCIDHIVSSKLNLSEFNFRDKTFVDAYWVPNRHTEKILKELTNKPIHKICYWINDKLFKLKTPKKAVKTLMKEPWENYEKFSPLENIPTNKIILGSFQRDTEGNGIQNGIYKPKLEKGPDIFLQIIKNLSKNKYFPYLSGYRRHYLASNFKKENINFYISRFVNNESLPKIYKNIDYYIVSSRFEGGPQAVLECAQLKVKILSTDVGIASEVLHPDCLCYSVNDFVDKIISNKIEHTIKYNFNKIKNYTLDKMMPLYDGMLENVLDR